MLVELTLLNGDKLAINPNHVVSFLEDYDSESESKCVKLTVSAGSCHFVKESYASVKDLIGVDPPYVF